MNYVQDLFLVVVFVHIASGPAALLLLLLLGFSDRPWKKKRDGSYRDPSKTELWGTLASLHGADVGETPALWESWLSPPPSGSSDRLRDAVLLDRRPMFSCVKGDPFGTSLLKGSGEKKVGGGEEE